MAFFVKLAVELTQKARKENQVLSKLFGHLLLLRLIGSFLDHLSDRHLPYLDRVEQVPKLDFWRCLQVDDNELMDEVREVEEFFNEQARVFHTDCGQTFHVEFHSFVKLLKRLVNSDFALITSEG